MYTFEGFSREIADIIMRYLPSDNYGEKNARIRSSAMGTDWLLIVPENNPGLTPCIGLKEYYNMYRNGMRFNDIVIAIAKIRESINTNIDTDNLFTMENIHNHLVMRLVPNSSGFPGIEIGDMKITFCLLFEDEPDNEDARNILKGGRIPLTDLATKQMNLDTKKLFHIAMKSKFFNSRYTVRPLKSTLLKEMGLNINDDNNGQVIITGEAMSHDAAGIFAPDIQQEVSEYLGNDYIVVMPAKHCAIAMRNGIAPDDELHELIKMAYEITAPEDRLSQMIYTMKGGMLIPA